MQRHARLQRFLAEAQAADPDLRLLDFDDLDSALEWCEERLLEDPGPEAREPGEVPLARHELLLGLDAGELALVSGRLERREYDARAWVVRQDEPADAIYLLVKGRLSVVVETVDGRLLRLSTLSPGMGLGEAALVEGATRTASVRADEPSSCWVLRADEFQALSDREPALESRLLENLLRATTRIVRQMNADALDDL
jgi:CRP-like cAMP-binding protein